MSTNSTTLNTLLKDTLYTKEDFKNIEPTYTSVIANTIIRYSKELNIFFCSTCLTSLLSNKVLEHLNKRHKTLLETYKEDPRYIYLLDIEKLYNKASIEEVKASIEYNSFYFKELALNLKGYKCLECDYLDTYSRAIRMHFRLKHRELYTSRTLKSKEKAYYILERVPLQIIDGFKYNSRVLFIPKLPNKEGNRSIERSRSIESKVSISRSRSRTREPSSSLIEPRARYKGKGKERVTNIDSSSSYNSINSSSSSLEEIESSNISSNPRDKRSKANKGIEVSYRDTILSSYREEIEKKNKDLDFITNIEGNKKLLNTFIAKSNIAEFLKNKDRNILISLVAFNLENEALEQEGTYNFNSKIEVVDFNLLEETIIEYLELINSKINNIGLLLRQRIKGSIVEREYKDFIPLESKNTKKQYFKLFANLIIYLVRLVYIKTALKDRTTPLDIKYKETLKGIEIDSELEATISNVLNTYKVGDIEEDKLEFYINLSNTFIRLLVARNPLAFRTNTTLNNIVISYFYIKCLSIRSKDIIPLNNISKLTSIIIYNTRLVTIGYFYLKELDEELEVDERTRENEIEEFLKSYLSKDSKNYFEFFNTLRPYLLALNREITSTNFLIREVRPNILELNSIEYSIEGIRKLFNNIVDKLEEVLTNKLLGLNTIDELDLDFSKLNDSSLYNKIGESLRDIEEIKDLKTTNVYFLDKLLTKGSYYNRKLLKSTSSSTIAFKPRAIERFNRDINKAIEYLALSIYLTSGGPLRATELSTIIYKNIESLTRSILYNNEEKLISITTNYYKSKNISRKEKTNLRYLSPRLSRLLIVYILYIIPFKEYILDKYYNNPNSSTPFLLVKDSTPLDTNSISRALKRESSLLFREGLTLKSYRKLINVIIKTKLDNYSYDSSSRESNSSNEDRIEDKQANRSKKVSLNYYYNVGSFFTKSSNLEVTRKTKEFSIKYFNYFNLLSKDDLYNSPLIRRYIGAKELEDYSKESFISNTISTSEIENNIRKLYKDTSLGFRNIEQKSGLLSLVDNNPIITFINRTSSGKSLLYLLPSFIFTSKVYFIITPRVTLTKDLYSRAKELGLRVGTLKDPFSLSINLIFINIEDLDTLEFNTFIKTYKYYKRDISIYIDEVHLFLLEKSFRLDLKYFTTIVKDRGNLVFLSATLPPSLLGILESTLGIKDKNLIIRGSSNREDIVYNRVLYRKDKDLETTLRDTLNKIVEKDLDSRNKILIFINNIEEGKTLSRNLNIDYIYSSKEDKDTILNSFLSTNDNSNRALLTTSILEVGLDLPSIVYTINLEPIYSLLSIVQSSGRIRGKGVSYIIDKEPSKYLRDSIKSNPILKNIDSVNDLISFKKLDKAYYKLFTIESNCLRLPISTLLDSTPRKCLEESSFKCSVCLERYNTLEELKSKEEREYRANNYSIIKLEESLVDLYTNYCFYCLINPYNFNNNYKHNIESCLSTKEDIELNSRVERVIELVKKPKVIENNTACFKCLVPKIICSKVSSAYNIESNKCFFNRYIYYILATFYTYRDELKDILDLGSSNLNELDFYYNLLRPSTLDNIYTIKIIELLSKLKVENLVKDLEDLNKELVDEDRVILDIESDSSESSTSSSSSLEDLEENFSSFRELTRSKEPLEEEVSTSSNLEARDNVYNIFKQFRKENIENKRLEERIEKSKEEDSSRNKSNRKRLKNLSIDIKDSNRVKGSSKKTRLEEE